MNTPSKQLGNPMFATTQWSVVMCAGRADDTASRQALESLCEKYWPALYGYVRRRGHSAEDAHDLTQEFFLRLLELKWLARADQSKGRFRSFILTVLKRFLADEWDKTKTLKRGGNVHLESLSEMAETVYAAHASAVETPDVDFERDWSNALLANVLNALEQNYARGGKAQLFSTLRNYLIGGKTQPAYAVAEAQLGMTESTFKTAVCRLRRRYRDRIKAEVAATVANPQDVAAELRHLYRIMARAH